MKIQVLASTKPGFSLPKEEALYFSGKSAGICYLGDSIDTLLKEPLSKTKKRAEGTLVSGHHSVFGHPTYNLCIEEAPKIIAMILNNEKIYNTSERSARYTRIPIKGREKLLYDKWILYFQDLIKDFYPNFDSKKIMKLSQENARYLVSIFSPYVTMEYTVNFCQLNYIINWAKNYINYEKENAFSRRVKEALQDFLDAMPDLEIEGLNSEFKNRKFSLFAERKRKEEFGENYSTNYMASFAELAQAQRHRTLYYEMNVPEEPSYYIPPIIRGTKLEEEWLMDISSLAEYFPQGMLIEINERGTIENFVLKCTERLCGAAQLEIMQQTSDTLQKYIAGVKDEVLLEYLNKYSKGARCTFPNFKCTSPCVFGPKGAMNRLI